MLYILTSSLSHSIVILSFVPNTKISYSPDVIHREKYETYERRRKPVEGISVAIAITPYVIADYGIL